MNDNIKRIRYSVKEEEELITSKPLKEIIELDISKYYLISKIADIIVSFLSKVCNEFVTKKDCQHILTCLNDRITYVHISNNIRYEIKEDTKNRLVIINVYDIKIENAIYNFEKVHEENNQ